MRADDGAGTAAGHRPGGVRRAGVGRLGEAEAEALGEEHERVEEAARQHDVVVDEQQPVVAGGRLGAQRGVEVVPLAGAGGGEDLAQLDGVARARELPAGARGRRGVLGARDREGQDPAGARRGGGARGAGEGEAPRQRAGGMPARRPRRARSRSRRPSVPELPDR